MTKIRIEVFRKTMKSIFGLFVFSIGDYLTIIANIGLTPWDSLSMAIANRTGLSFGRISIVISFIIIVIDLILKENIGLGTVLDALLVGTFIDTFTIIFKIPYASNVLIALVYISFGLLIMACGQTLYMSAGLSCGPRDSLLVAVSKRFPKYDIGYIDISMKVVIILASYFLDGPIGIGTIYSMVGMGIAMNIVFKIFKFEPRDIKQENLIRTLQKLVGGNK